jgi:predicted RNA-binding protein with PUA-like domain
MAQWLVKTEPSTYSWSQLERDKRAIWDGVRNHQAKHNLAGMKKGDSVLIYHSGEERRVVGVARVSRGAFPDQTADEGDWIAVELEAVRPLGSPVGLAAIKSHPSLRQTALIRQSRLSVMPLTDKEFRTLVSLGRGKT